MSTTISIVNQLGQELEVKHSVSPSLGSGYWACLDTQVLATPTDVMEFNRNVGIKDGQTWIFTTAFTLDGIDVQLQEKVTGTHIPQVGGSMNSIFKK